MYEVPIVLKKTEVRNVPSSLKGSTVRVGGASCIQHRNGFTVDDVPTVCKETDECFY